MGASEMSQSGPFTEAVSDLIQNGYSPIPVIPGSKEPRPKWDQYRARPMSDDDISTATLSTPMYGVAVCGGYNGLVPIDIDTDDEDIIAAIRSALPISRVGKRGQNGFTLFFRTSDTLIIKRGRRLKHKNGSMICEFLVNNYTVIPPTIHPGTKLPYAWIDPEATLITTPASALPELTKDHIQALEEALSPWLASKVVRLRKPSGEDKERVRHYGMSILAAVATELTATDKGRNNKLFDAVCRLGGFVHHGLIPLDSIVSTLREACVANGYVSEHGEEAFNATVESGLKKSEDDQFPVVPDETANDPRPQIKLYSNQLDDIATKAEQLLLQAGEPIFQRALRLVRPVVDETISSGLPDRPTKTAALREVNTQHLRRRADKHIQWKRFDRREKRWIPTNAPLEVIEAIMANDGYWMFPPISGVITCPTVRPDGSLIQEQGYDPITRMYLIEPLQLPDILSHPTKSDAQQALARIAALIETFPFVDDVSRSVALSAFVSAVCRGAFPVVPMHIARAPVHSSGKSYLWDVLASIATGRSSCPIIAAGRTEEETEKRLAAALLVGSPLINIDNVNGELGGDFLCQAIERPEPSMRILGRSEKVELVNRTTILATGNNIRARNDLTRRVMYCDLDPKTENPEMRKFSTKPKDIALANRAAFVAAALNVVRAYMLAGQPDKKAPLASFEGWSDMIRSAMCWLGYADPVDSLEKVRSEDPVRQTLRAVLLAWEDELGVGANKSITAAQILNSLEPTISKDDTKKYCPRLRQALGTIDARGVDSLNPTRLGKWLADHKGRILEGLSLNRMTDRKGTSTWYIEHCQ